MSRTPTLAEVIHDAIDDGLASLRVCMPVMVVAYHNDRHTVDVQCAVKLFHVDARGERVATQVPIITDCPVQFPGGGGFSVTFPIVAGDTGIVVFSDVAIAKWYSGRGTHVVTETLDHSHNISDAFFIPGYSTVGGEQPATANNAMLVGVGETHQGAALGDSVHTQLERLRSWLAIVTAGAAYTGLVEAAAAKAAATLTPSIPSVSSTTVKVSP